MGSILNNAKLIQAQIEFSALFKDALAITTPRDQAIELLSREVKVNTKVQLHNWLGDVPPMSEWTAERPIGKVAADGYQITSRKFANGLEVNEDDLEDDNLDLYAPRIQDLGQQVIQLKINLLMQILTAGFGTTLGPGYDGVSFFNDNHPNMVGAAQSNLVHHTLDDTGALYEAIAKMTKIRNLGGKPANFYPTHLFYGPDNQANVDALLNVQFLANGASNPFFNKLTPVLSQYLVNGPDGNFAGYWFIADLSRSMKPLIWQLRRAARFQSVGASGTGATEYERFLRGSIYYGVDMRCNAGYGLWQPIVGSDGSS